MSLKKPSFNPFYPILAGTSRFFLLFISFIFSSLHLNAQNTDISGIVNTYHRVIEIIPAKACIRLNTLTGLVVNQKVMIVQMKGASVITTNTSSFGDTTNLNMAGNYEIGTICAMNNDSIFLFHDVLNQYSIPDKVQVVGIPSYFSATVTGTLKAAPWNNTTGTGGVLAIDVDQSLTLNAPISADSMGYKGGEFRLSSGSCSNFSPANLYYYDGNILSPQDGSFKGESIFALGSSNSGGRGAAANGGGGGNNHNNGGGGGANLSAGGNGGGNSSSTGCTVSLRGIAGKALSNYGGQKIFMGGGGGAGHANNGTAAYGGGNGGGIIFIIANSVIGNDQIISANGQQGADANSDGGSGGGAAGTVIMNINTWTGNAFLEAKGGKGGDENDGLNIRRCYGAGGGGSGGAIYFSGSIPAISTSVIGGPGGIAISSDPACNVPVPAAVGNNGQLTPNYSYSRSTDEASYCALLLPLRLIYFNARLIRKEVQLNWRLAKHEAAKEFTLERSAMQNDYISLKTIPATEGIETYRWTDENPNFGYNQYRLKIIGKNNEVKYSVVQYVYYEKKSGIIIYPNPAKRKILISGNFSHVSEVKLVDISGKIVLNQKLALGNPTAEINLPTLTKGIYILQIGADRKKIIIE